jgi:methionine synthase II (cobalamin-independent)
VEARDYETLRDVALILTDHVEALDCANGRIVAIDEIMVAYEAALNEGK